MPFHLKLAGPTKIMTKVDIWVERLVMLSVAISYTSVFIYLIIKRADRSKTINAIFLSAILFGSINFVQSLVNKCYTMSWCYDLDAVGLLFSGLYHWLVSWIYLKAAIEMPFYFNIGLYVKDQTVVAKLQKSRKYLNIIFWANIALMIIVLIVELILEWFSKYEAFGYFLLSMIFFEITIFLLTVCISLVKIYKTINHIPELRINRIIMCLHFSLMILLSVAFFAEYVEYFGFSRGWINIKRNVLTLSILFCIKTILLGGIYALLLYMLV